MRCIASSFFLLISFLASGQDFVLSGSALDENNDPMLYGDVVLHDLEGEVIEYAFIEDGRFSFDPVALDTYLLKITALGFAPFEETVILDHDRELKIQLHPLENQMDEITIKAERKAIVNKNGNLKFNVANSLFATEPTTFDLLSKLPKVEVGADGNSLSIIGNGSPLIYVGNQQITMMELIAIPVESIKDIEIINNPSSKYEANGRVVLLITKVQQRSDGYQLQFQERNSFRKQFNNYNSINGSFRKGSLELKADVAYNFTTFFESVESLINIPSEEIEMYSFGESKGANNNYRYGGGAYYQLTDTQYLSIGTNYTKRSSEAPLITESVFKDGSNVDSISSLSQDTDSRTFFSSNLNYNWKMDNANLFVGMQFSDFVRALESDISVDINNQGFNPIQYRDQSYTIQSLGGKLDYEYEVSEGWNWELGNNISQAKGLAFSHFDYLESGLTQTSNYDYKEQNVAFYSQIAGQYDKMHLTAGLRSETTNVIAGFRSIDKPLIDYRKTILFPKGTINYDIDSTKSISINVAKHIRRPSYLRATSITTFLNPSLEYSRNVNLRPTITQDLSLNFQYLDYSIKATYYRQERPIDDVYDFDKDSRQIIASPENLQKGEGVNLEFVIPIEYKRWRSTNVIITAINSTTDSRGIINRARPIYYLYSKNHWRLKKGFQLGASFFGISLQDTGLFQREANYLFIASASKRWKDFNFSLSSSDIFNTRNIHHNYTFNNIQIDNQYFLNGRHLTLSVSYTIGKTAKSSYKNEDVDDNINRL